MRRLVDISDQTWARVKYQVALKHKKTGEVVEDLLTHALSDWESRGKL